MIGTKLCFVDTTGKLVKIVGNKYSIDVIRKITDIFWLEYPVEWVDEWESVDD